MKRSLCAIALLASACSSAVPPEGSDVDATYSAGPFTIQPGEDKTICSYVRGTNEEAADVSAFITDQVNGGHHIIVYAVDHPIDLPPSVCTQGGQPGWDTLLVSQQQHEEVRFPVGVGYRIGPQQQFVIETHYINASAEPIEAESKLGVVYAELGSVKDRAATYYFGTMNIDVPANGHATSTGACSPPIPMTVRTMLGHQHRMGTSLDVQFIPGDGNAPVDLYESTDWHAAPLATFDGLTVSTTDKLAVTCEWTNTSPERLRYPREMCFAIGYHWPAEVGFTCVSGGGSDACTCFERGNLDVGPGGGAVDLTVRRAADVPGAGGPLDAGDAVYCFLYREEDYGPAGPVAGARPRYFRDAQGEPLKSEVDTIEIAFDDITPGSYVASCMLDVIGGGFVPGSGNVVNVPPALVKVDDGQAAAADVTLNFALP